jgi:acyl-CoA synthetase (AMP-forming)/AMP-acid ligase II
VAEAASTNDTVSNDAISNIAAMIDRPAELAADRRALILDDGSWCTYRQLRAAVMDWAAALAGHGIGAGHTVALADWGGVRSTAVTLAAAHLGAATAQMNPRLTAGELAQLVEVSHCSAVGVAEADAVPALTDALRQAWGAEGRVLSRPDAAAATGADAAATGATGATGEPPRDEGGAATVLVLFTSGTTGLPKPVGVTHDATVARMAAYRAPFDPDRAPNVSLMCVPSFHVGGMLGLLLNLYSGDTTVIQPRFDAGAWLALVAEHRVTSAFVVPTMLGRILDHPDLAITDLSSLRAVAYGAAAAPVELIRRAMAQWPDVAFTNVFGQTETLGAYTTLSAADHHDPARAGSVGRPMRGVSVRVVDPDTGEDVAPGQVGELWVQGAQNVGPGWLHTGDLGRQDADGYLYPTGRRSDGINRGGEKFQPHEVADALRPHPAVADVVVVGLPDPEMGERVGVAIVVAAGQPTPTLDELRDWCRPRLAPFKLPEVLAVVEALPSNDLGKLPRPMAVELIRSSSPESSSPQGSPP